MTSGGFPQKPNSILYYKFASRLFLLVPVMDRAGAQKQVFPTLVNGFMVCITCRFLARLSNRHRSSRSARLAGKELYLSNLLIADLARYGSYQLTIYISSFYLF